jgi:hypothetical protein
MMEIIEPSPPNPCPTCKPIREREEAAYNEMNRLFPIQGDGTLSTFSPLYKQRYEFLKQALPDGFAEENCPSCGGDVPAGFNDDDDDDDQDDEEEGEDDGPTCSWCGWPAYDDGPDSCTNPDCEG